MIGAQYITAEETEGTASAQAPFELSQALGIRLSNEIVD